MAKEHKQYIRYSDRQKEAARETDIMEFLRHYEGFTFARAGHGFRCEQHNSLVIDADHKRWYWNSKGIGGNNAVDYLTSIHGMSFLEAMDVLIGKDRAEISKAPKLPPQEKEVKELILPEKAEGKHSRAFAYLMNSRGIDKDLIAQCMKDKLIYQDKNNNVVFVGYDELKNPQFACVRGTLSDVQYRGDCKGSDKTYGFSIKGTEPDRLYVFEAPIDLLSYVTLSKQLTGNDNWKKHNYLTLSGTSDVALAAYLERNKNVKAIVFCLDNDEAGNEASQKHINKYTQQGYVCIRKAPKLKDFNDDLKNHRLSFQKIKKEGDFCINSKVKAR
jgi:hypothetical protein